MGAKAVGEQSALAPFSVVRRFTGSASSGGCTRSASSPLAGASAWSGIGSILPSSRGFHRAPLAGGGLFGGDLLRRCAADRKSRFSGDLLRRCAADRKSRFSGDLLRRCAADRKSRFSGDLLRRCAADRKSLASVDHVD